MDTTCAHSRQGVAGNLARSFFLNDTTHGYKGKPALMQRSVRNNTITLTEEVHFLVFLPFVSALLILPVVLLGLNKIIFNRLPHKKFG